MVTNWVVGANGEINIGTVETRRPTSPVRAVLVPKVAVESEYGSVGATREGLGGARAAPLTSMPSTIFSLRALFTGLFCEALFHVAVILIGPVAVARPEAVVEYGAVARARARVGLVCQIKFKFQVSKRPHGGRRQRRPGGTRATEGKAHPARARSTHQEGQTRDGRASETDTQVPGETG